jgi:hypothetical protein
MASDESTVHAAPAPRRLTLASRAAAVQARVRPLLPALRLVGFGAAVAIVGWMGFRAAREVHPRDLAWWPLPFALAAAATWWLLLARGWALLLSGRPTRRDVSVWCRTQALRFLPGGIWAPASRVAVVHGTPFDRVATVAAENLGAVCAALAVGGLALGASGRPLWLGVAAAVAVPVVAATVVRGRTRVAPARAARATVNYVLAFLAYAAASVLVQLAVSGHVDPLSVAGAASVAWAAGLVVVIAPSGIGVREVVYVDLLHGTLPFAALAGAAVTMRLTMIVAELAVLVIAGRPPAEPRRPVPPGE